MVFECIHAVPDGDFHVRTANLLLDAHAWFFMVRHQRGEERVRGKEHPPAGIGLREAGVGKRQDERKTRRACSGSHGSIDVEMLQNKEFPNQM
jgi:hypothetical protein